MPKSTRASKSKGKGKGARAAGASAPPKAPSGWDAFYRVMRRIPRGRVTTYGAVAELAGRPRAARHVGFALAAAHAGKRGVPWQRVLGAASRGFARVAIRDPFGGALQRELLEGEGVAFDARDRVSLEEFGWRPRARAR